MRVWKFISRIFLNCFNRVESLVAIVGVVVLYVGRFLVLVLFANGLRIRMVGFLFELFVSW